MASEASTPEISGYRVVKTEGRGATGTLYRGRSVKKHTLVAIKELTRQLTSHASFVKSIQNGVQRLSRVDHPNVARPYQFGKTGDRYYLISEFVEGESLRDRLRQQGRIPEKAAREYLLQAARGLKAAHAVGVLHYDLKPSNILLSEDDEARVVDFPLDYHRYVESVRGEQVFEMMEFPLYMSPEERERKELTARSNIFSLGAIFYHMVYGAPLLFLDGKRRPPPSLAENEQPSPETCQLLERMLIDAPGERFADFDELVSTLEGPSLAKVDPVAAGLYLGAALAVVLALVLFYRGGSGAVGDDPNDPDGGGGPGAVDSIDPESRGPEGEFKAAEAFVFQHSDRVDEAIRRFERVARRHEGTLWATNAQERINALKQVREERREEQWLRLTRDLERLCKQECFAEALRRVNEFAEAIPDPGWKERVGSRKEELESKEQAGFDALRGRVAELAARGDAELARKELQFAAANYSLPEIIEAAKSGLALVEREASGAEAGGSAELHVDTDAEEDSFRSFVQQMTASLERFKYLRAEHLCRQAIAKFKGKEFREFARACADAIIEDQKFIKRLFDRINARGEQAPIIYSRGEQKLRVYSADWDGISVSPSGKEKSAWQQFPAIEIYRMLDQKVERKQGGEHLGMGRFCYLRGLWDNMSQKFDLAKAFSPGLSSEVERFPFSHRLRMMLAKDEGD